MFHVLQSRVSFSPFFNNWAALDTIQHTNQLFFSSTLRNVVVDVYFISFSRQHRISTKNSDGLELFLWCWRGLQQLTNPATEERSGKGKKCEKVLCWWWCCHYFHFIFVFCFLLSQFFVSLYIFFVFLIRTFNFSLSSTLMLLVLLGEIIISEDIFREWEMVWKYSNVSSSKLPFL